MNKNIKKRVGAFLLSAAMASQLFGAWAAGENFNVTSASVAKGAASIVLQLDNPKMLVDGMPMLVDSRGNVNPIIREDRTLLPLRGVCEALGCTVTWNGTTSVATVTYEETSIGFWINNKKIQITKNGEKTVKAIDVAPIIIDNFTMLPIRYLEELGFTVDWEPTTRSIIVSNEYTTNGLVVKMKGTEKLTADMAQGGTIVSQTDGNYLIRYDSLNKAKAAKDVFAVNRNIEYAQPQRVLYTSSAYNSYVPEKIGADGFLKHIEAENSKEIITVALLDTGIADSKGSFYYQRIARGEIDLVEKDNKADDDNGHGTQMAGVIAELTGSNVEILPIKVLNSQGRGTDTDVAQGILYAIEEGADVIVMGCNGSVAKTIPSAPIADAVTLAKAKGIPVVAPAGNERLNLAWSVVSSNSDVITVTSTDKDDKLSEFNNYGENVVVAAPGVDINTTTLKDKFVTVSGSSMSAAVVAGMLANYKIADKEALYSDFITFISDNTIDKGLKGKDAYFGYGRIDLSSYKGVTIDPENPIDPDVNPDDKTIKTYTLPQSQLKVQKGMSISLPVREVYTDGSYKDMTYDQAVAKGVKITTTKEDVADITTKGMITGKEVGKTDVRFEFVLKNQTVLNSLPDGIMVIEPKPMSYISFEPSKKTIAVGDSFTVKAYMNYKDGTREELTGSQYAVRSYDKAIVDTTSNGEFYGIKEGIATIVFVETVEWGQYVEIKGNVVKVQSPAGMSLTVKGLIAEGKSENEYINLTNAVVKAYDSNNSLVSTQDKANNGESYLLDRLKSGMHTIKVTHSDYNAYSLEASVKDGKVTDKEAVMQQTVYSLSGTAYIKGEPLKNKAITYTHEKGTKIYSLVTDASGKFVLPEKFIDGKITFTYNEQKISASVRSGSASLEFTY